MVLQVYKTGYLAHLYWGQKVEYSDLSHIVQIDALPWETNKRMADCLSYGRD